MTRLGLNPDPSDGWPKALIAGQRDADRHSAPSSVEALCDRYPMFAAGLGPFNRTTLAGLPFVSVDIDKDSDIGCDERCCLLLDGLAARSSLTPSGQRQITGFLVPGNVVTSPLKGSADADQPILALSGGKVAAAPMTLVKETLAASPRVAQVFWSAVVADIAITRRWLVSLGRRSAMERAAHLMCELLVRMGFGPPDALAFDFPVTQQQLADALGLSTVHANRVLQSLRAQRLLVFEHGRVEILDWQRLAELADFDPGYLGGSPARRG